MTKPLLSIQIPTTSDRDKQYALLEEEIRNQCVAMGEEPLEGFEHAPGFGGWRGVSIEFMYYRDNKELSIGEKRDRMYKASTGLYSWQIDSDDWIAPKAIEKVLYAMDGRPDCITFQERVSINGELFRSNHSIGYNGWYSNYGEWDFIRCPYMKDVVLTSIAQAVPVPFIRWNEDEQWSMVLRPLLLTERHLNEEIYYYQHTSSEHNQRYGIS